MPTMRNPKGMFSPIHYLQLLYLTEWRVPSQYDHMGQRLIAQSWKECLLCQAEHLGAQLNCQKVDSMKCALTETRELEERRLNKKIGLFSHNQ